MDGQASRQTGGQMDVWTGIYAWMGRQVGGWMDG